MSYNYTFRLLTACFFLLPSAIFSQLLNPGFEDATVDTIPLNWGRIWAGLSTDAHSGQYSMYTSNWYFYGRGMIYNGEESPNVTEYSLISVGTPLTDKPSYLEGFYKYIPGNNQGAQDSAYAMVILKKWNATNNDRDTVGYAKMKLGPANTWTLFTMPIDDWMPGFDPDSIIVCFVSSESGFCDGDSTGHTCLFLYLDDLSLGFPLGVKNIDDLFSSISVGPNPANEFVEIKMPFEGMKTIRISNLNGELIYSEKTRENSRRILMNDLPASVYLLEIETERDKIFRKKISLVN